MSVQVALPEMETKTNSRRSQCSARILINIRKRQAAHNNNNVEWVQQQLNCKLVAQIFVARKRKGGEQGRERVSWLWKVVTMTTKIHSRKWKLSWEQPKKNSSKWTTTAAATTIISNVATTISRLPFATPLCWPIAKENFHGECVAVVSTCLFFFWLLYLISYFPRRGEGAKKLLRICAGRRRVTCLFCWCQIELLLYVCQDKPAINLQESVAKSRENSLKLPKKNWANCKKTAATSTKATGECTRLYYTHYSAK